MGCTLVLENIGKNREPRVTMPVNGDQELPSMRRLWMHPMRNRMTMNHMNGWNWSIKCISRSNQYAFQIQDAAFTPHVPSGVN
jgi:hypothetical protein